MEQPLEEEECVLEEKYESLLASSFPFGHLPASGSWKPSPEPNTLSLRKNRCLKGKKANKMGHEGSRRCHRGQQDDDDAPKKIKLAPFRAQGRTEVHVQSRARPRQWAV